MRVTRGREGGEVSPALLQKFEKCPNLWKKMPWFLKVSRRKNRIIFPCGAFLSCVIGECLAKCPNSKKTPLPLKIPGCRSWPKVRTVLLNQKQMEMKMEMPEHNSSHTIWKRFQWNHILLHRYSSSCFGCFLIKRFLWYSA